MSATVHSSIRDHIFNDMDTEMDRLERFMNLYEKVKEMGNEDEYMTAKDIAKVFNCSMPEALKYMQRPDFPVIECGKEKKVHRLAFMMYNMQPRRKET